METGISLRNVTATYGDGAVLKGLSLDCAVGEVSVVMGASGSGKSTLLRVVAGLLKPTEGTVLVKDEGRPLGYVMQELHLWPLMTCIENLTFAPTRTQLMARDRAITDAVDLLRRYGLDGLESRRPTATSGGQRQRLAICRALMMSPTVLMLDEPSAALDPPRSREIGQMLVEIARQGKTVLIVTHSSELAYFADHVHLLEGGAIRESTTGLSLMDAPASDIMRFLCGTDQQRRPGSTGA